MTDRATEKALLMIDELGLAASGVKTLRCPFCGAQPTTRARFRNGPDRIVECEDQRCPVMPSARGATLAAAVDNWNTRA